MADLRITLEDLKDRRRLVEKRKQGRLVDTPLKTTRSKRVNAGEDVDPFGSSILGLSRIFLGIPAVVTAEDLMGRYEKLMTQGLSGILFEGDGEGFADLLPTEGFSKLLSKNVLAGVTPSDDVSGDPSSIVELALSEVGTPETESGINKYAFHVGHEQKRPWSMTFISYLFQSLEVEDPVVEFANPEDARRAAEQSQRFGDTPRVGAIVFYAFNTSRLDNTAGVTRANHSGLVVSLQNSGQEFAVVEGNTWPNDSGRPQQDGTGVHPRVRKTSDSSVMGFYYPDYRSSEEQYEALRKKARSGGSSGTDGGTSSGGGSSGPIGDPSTQGFINPLETMDKSSGFGPRSTSVGSSVHKGIDLRIPQGSPVRAVKAGKIIHRAMQGNDEGYGNYIKIDHGNGLETRYAHLSQFQVALNDQVSQGQIIALSGGAKGVRGSGTSSGPHLHFEVRVNRTAKDPEQYLDF